tara:strand:+ start:22770 stop:23045 length:276 start_codon:yes stop_codon:yes gene_type:complete
MSDDKMKFSVTLGKERSLKSVSGENLSEFELCLQVWQDLVKMNPTYQEDLLIKNILEQILVSHYGDKDTIPFPKCYEEKVVEIKSENKENE